jgi:recombination protein RecA
MPKKKQSATDTLSRKAVIESLNAHFGPNTLVKLGKKQSIRIRSVPTGSLELDYALGCGGWPRGRVVEIFGRNSGGKTTLVGHAIASVQKMGGAAAYIDAEHKIDPEYFAALGVDIDDVDISQPDSAEQALFIAEKLIESGHYDLVALDSIAMMTPASELDGDYVARDGAGMERAQLLSKHFRRMKGVVNNGRTIYLCVNQIRDTMGKGEVQPGGNGLKFAAAARVRVDQWWVDGKWTGIRTNVVKNQVGGRPYSKAEMPWAETFNTGLDFTASVVRIAPDMGVLDKRGSHYYWAPAGEEPTRIAQGWASCARYFEENPEHLAELLRQVDVTMNWNR